MIANPCSKKMHYRVLMHNRYIPLAQGDSVSSALP